MTSLIFTKTEHWYDSYTDFWRLVELSGFPTTTVNLIDLHDPTKTYITSPLNGELKAHLDWSQGRQCKIYLWNLERPGGSGSLGQYKNDNQALIDQGFVDKIIVSDMSLARDTGFHYVPVGSHEKLGVPEYDKSTKVYDFIHLMCHSGRRSLFFDYLTPRRVLNGFSIAPTGWGEARDWNIRSSKFMLNIHQDDHRYIEPLRFALAAAYGIPVLSETLLNSFPYPSDMFLQFNYIQGSNATFRAMHYALDNYDEMISNADIIRELMTTSFSFRKCLELYL
jgi:hypothetical protein